MNKSLSELEPHAEDAANFLKQLANAKRLMILCALIEKELSVGELNSMIPLSQSALSQHLASLRDAELVDTRRSAQQVLYRLKNPAVTEMIQVLQKNFCS